jgi:membrane-bound inhibitor of C-type lysozyme
MNANTIIWGAIVCSNVWSASGKPYASDMAAVWLAFGIVAFAIDRFFKGR